MKNTDKLAQMELSLKNNNTFKFNSFLKNQFKKLGKKKKGTKEHPINNIHQNMITMKNNIT